MNLYMGKAISKGQVSGGKLQNIQSACASVFVCVGGWGVGVEFRTRDSCCFGRTLRCVSFSLCICMPTKIASVVSDWNRCPSITTHTHTHNQTRDITKAHTSLRNGRFEAIYHTEF